MAIRGSLKEASLPDVLQLLAMGKKTGCLSVTHRNNFGYIYFDKGRICYASIVNRRDRLGDMLVKSGVITQAQLDAAHRRCRTKRHDKRLGELLVEQGALTRRAAARRRSDVQIEEAVYFLFTWNQGTFNFEADVAPDEQDLRRLDQPRVAAARGRAPRGRVGPHREEDSDASTSSSRRDHDRDR